MPKDEFGNEFESLPEGEARVEEIKKKFYHLKPQPSVAPGPESAEGCREDVGEKITEELLRKLKGARLALKMAEAQEEALTAAIRQMVGLERGLIQRGKMVLKAKERKGRTDVDWKAWIKAEYDKEYTAVIPAEYIKTGNPVVVLEVEELP